MQIRKWTLFLACALHFAGVVRAQVPQIPDTPAGRQFSAWRNAQDSGDRTTIQQFIDKSMPWASVDQELSMGSQAGGWDVKQVEASSDTNLVVLAQARGGARQFARITKDVAATEPHQIAGIRVQPTQPPAEFAPPKMTAAEVIAARAAPPFLQYNAWLDAFNSGDRTRIGQYLLANWPRMGVDAQMTLRQRTGGFDFRTVEQATPTSVIGLMQEHDSDQFVRFVITVDAAAPHAIAGYAINAIPRPPGFPVPRASEAEVIAQLRAKLTKDAADDRFAGAVLLAGNGKVLFSSAYGMADREQKLANKLDTRFRIGSMNKMFTAVSILQLVQAGKIKLDDPLGKHLTDYPNQDVAKVTIHQLLTHTGGTGDIFGPEYESRRLQLKTPQDYVALHGKRAPLFEPGSRWVYSNYGMLLLGVVIEKASGQNYYDYVADHIYMPAGMTSSGSEPESQPVRDRSIGYMSRPGGGWTPNTDTLPYRGSPAGGGYSTVGDLLKFADALTSHRLLNARNTDLLITGKVDTGQDGRRYAYGFEDGRTKEGEGAVGHSGGAPGMNGDLRIYPKSGYVTVVLSNLDPPAAQQVSAYLGLRLK